MRVYIEIAPSFTVSVGLAQTRPNYLSYTVKYHELSGTHCTSATGMSARLLGIE